MIEIGPSDAGTTAIVLHGLGASSSDLEPLAVELRKRGLALRCWLPDAPMRAVTINNGYVMPAWYDIRGADFARESAPAGLAESRTQIRELIARARQDGEVVLIGFSQGAVLALHTALTYPGSVKAVAALSGYLTPDAYASQNLAIFQAHGTYDEIIPIAAALGSRDALIALGCAVEWHEYPLGHHLSEALVDDLGRWLVEQLT